MQTSAFCQVIFKPHVCIVCDQSPIVFDAREWKSGHILFFVGLSVAKKNLPFPWVLICKRKRFHIWHVYSTNETLSNDTKVNDLDWDLWPRYISKYFNLCHNFWTIRGRVFIFHTCIPCDETITIIPKVFTLSFYLHFWKFKLYITLDPMKEALQISHVGSFVMRPFQTF